MSLYEPAVFGALQLSNRVVMGASHTRTRADDDGVPTTTMAEYYRQRAGQGLIISEARGRRSKASRIPDSRAS